MRNQIESDLVLNEFGIPNLEKTVPELIAEYKEASARIKKPKTLQMISYTLGICERYFTDRKIATLKSHDFEQFKNWLLSEKSAKNKMRSVHGVKIILRNVRACFAYALKCGYIKSNPVAGIDNLKYQEVSRFLSDEEVSILYKACRFNAELAKIMLVAMFTGMRRGEILNLDSKQIQGDRIFLQKTKTGNPRSLPIHNRLADILKGKQGLIFEGWTINRFNRAWQRVQKRAKLGRIRFHDLRHTFCSNYLRNGGTIADLMQITGHKSLASLQIYTHFQTSYTHERINKVNYDFHGANLGQTMVNSADNADNASSVKISSKSNPPRKTSL